MNQEVYISKLSLILVILIFLLPYYHILRIVHIERLRNKITQVFIYAIWDYVTTVSDPEDKTEEYMVDSVLEGIGKIPYEDYKKIVKKHKYIFRDDFRSGLADYWENYIFPKMEQEIREIESKQKS